MTTLQLISAFSDRDAAGSAATAINGILLTANAPETTHLPFAALVLGVTDDLTGLIDAADVGTYLACERTIKNLPLSDLGDDTGPACVGIFTLVANPMIGPAAADRHWRDQHAPLALEVHTAMSHYYQLSIIHAFKGPEWNGIALCCFSSEADLRLRFFNSKEGEAAVAKDVAYFADTKRSPRRVIASFTGKQH